MCHLHLSFPFLSFMPLKKRAILRLKIIVQLRQVFGRCAGQIPAYRKPGGIHGLPILPLLYCSVFTSVHGLGLCGRQKEFRVGAWEGLRRGGVARNSVLCSTDLSFRAAAPVGNRWEYSCIHPIWVLPLDWEGLLGSF